MTTQLSTKISALLVSLLLNSLMIGTVALLFNGQSAPTSLAWSTVPVTSTASTTAV